MLLATLTANLQSSYTSIQVQIEALQEQQRLIQAQLQRVGSVESKMESAAALIQEAIAEIREVCPDELSAYQEVISGLFCSSPIAQIQAGEDITAEPEPQENPVSPQSDLIEEPAIDVAAVVTEEVQEVTEQVQEEASPVEQVVVSHQVRARSLHRQPSKPLQWLAAKRNIDTTGMRRHQIASALVGLVTQAELEEAIAQTENVG